jgi:glycerol-3-phosphate acyltransferase PlsY
VTNPDLVASLIALVAGYLIGGIPFAFIIGKMKGVDIRVVGSGNVGATNLGRAIGRSYGLIALALDIAKGLVPVLLVSPITVVVAGGTNHRITEAAMALGTIVGHVFTPYLFFRGGKGVATTIGAFAALLQFWILLPLGGYFLVRKLSGYVSAGSITLAVLLPVAAALMNRSELSAAWPVVVLAGAVGALVLVRHRSNVVRLIQGREHAAAGGGAPRGDGDKT